MTLYATLDNDGLFISQTQMLDRYQNSGVRFSLEKKKFEVIEWYDGGDENIVSEHDDPKEAIEVLKNLT